METTESTNFTKDGVFPVEELGCSMRNEKLAAICIWSRIGHGEFSGAIVAAMREALVFKLITRVASPRTFGASTLNHEVFDHSVKDQAVIKTLRSKIQEASTGDWGVA